MEVITYKKFNLIPKAENIKNKIPVFALQCYADWIQLIKGYTTLWFEGLAKADVRFIIPFSIMKKGPFKKGMFLTDVLSLGESYSLELERDFLNSIMSKVKSKNLCDWIQQPPNWAIFNTYPDGAIYTPFGSYYIDIKNNSLEQLFSNIKRKDRQEIRKAISIGVEVKKGNKHLPDAFELIQYTAKKAEISYPKYSIFLNMHKKLNDNIFSYVAYFKKIPQFAVVFFSSPYCTYGMYAGTINKAAKGSTKYLFWHAIMESKLRGVQLFDFVGARINPPAGSKDERIQRFKESLGARLRVGYLWKFPISNIKYRFYNQLVKTRCILKNRKYKGDIIDQELNRC